MTVLHDDDAQHSVRSDRRRSHVLRCAECGAESDESARRWRACRTDEPQTSDPPQVAFYCPACSIEHFG